MRTRTWLVILGALALAGLADAGTFARVPAAIAAYDFSPVARGSGAVVTFAAKMQVAVCIGCLVPIVRAVGRTLRAPTLAKVYEAALAAVAILSTGLWTAGAWSNVPYMR